MGLSTLNSNAFFRVELVTWSITSIIWWQKELLNYVTPTTDATSKGGGAWSPSHLRPYFSSTSHASLTKYAFWPVEKGMRESGRQRGRRLSTEEKRTKLEEPESLLRLLTGCYSGLRSPGRYSWWPFTGCTSLDRNCYSLVYRHYLHYVTAIRTQRNEANLPHCHWPKMEAELLLRQIGNEWVKEGNPRSTAYSLHSGPHSKLTAVVT